MKKILKIGSAMILIGAIVIAGLLLRDVFEFSKLNRFILDLGVWGPILFIGIYALATVLFLPGSVLTLTGGFVFGPLLGLLYNLTGAVLGATLAFLIARFIASDWVEHKIGGKLMSLKDGVEEQGWKFVAVVGLVPMFPFNLLNYALGLTQISLLGYVLASAIFMLPGAAAYTYLGTLGEAAISGEPKELLTKIVIAFSLLILVAMIPWMIKTFKKQNNT